VRVACSAALVSGVVASLMMVSGAGSASETRYRNGVALGGAERNQGSVAGASSPLQAERTTGSRRVAFETQGRVCDFDGSQPLREEYAGRGVHFRGATTAKGGFIVHQCGNFGVPARSGKHFLAFNKKDFFPSPPERVHFDALQRNVQLYAAAGSSKVDEEVRFSLIAKREGTVRARTVVTTTIRGYVSVRVAAPAGIDTVVLRSSTVAFVVDDLTFVPLL
jgi:hypothetical protein